MNDVRKSAIAKLAKMGLTEEEVLSLFTFDEYYDDVVNERIEVHYNWKQMLGLEKPAVIPVDPDVKTEKFIKNGN